MGCLREAIIHASAKTAQVILEGWAVSVCEAWTLRHSSCACVSGPLYFYPLATLLRSTMARGYISEVSDVQSGLE